MRHPVTISYTIRTSRWHADPLRIVVLSDLHIVAPWTSLAFLRVVVARINALTPDLVLIPGDFLADPKLLGRRASAHEIVSVIEGLSALHGVHATLGNHDWADCPLARETNGRRNSVADALNGSKISFYDNTACRVGEFWVAGVDSMVGAGSMRRPDAQHDLEAALAEVPEGASLILIAHEPDLWVDRCPPAALTVSGHTHGGQLILGNWRPLTPSRYGQRYAHGLFADDGRHLVVSAGLGYTAVPIRIGVPPEITLVTLTGA
ncbi:MAG: metallophosphoesterase [Pseudomonadota bacterium]